MKKSMLLSIITLLGCNDNSSTTPTTPSIPSIPSIPIPQIPPAHPDDDDDNLNNKPGNITFIEGTTDEEKKKMLEVIYEGFQKGDPSFVIPSDTDVNGLTLPKKTNDLFCAFSTRFVSENNPIKELDLSNLDTKNVADMMCAFADCKNLKKINLSNWDVTHCTTFSQMFAECYSLEEIIGIDGWGEIINKLPDPKRATRNMFRGCNIKAIPQWYKDLHPDWESLAKK